MFDTYTTRIKYAKALSSTVTLALDIATSSKSLKLLETDDLR